MFGGLLALIPAGIAMALTRDFPIVYVVTFGLLLFALLFAANSALHSYLIVRFARADGASLDIGFYYMANAGGRLAGTIASGALYQWTGLESLLMDIGSFDRVRVNHSAVGTRRRRRRRVASTCSTFNASYLNDVKLVNPESLASQPYYVRKSSQNDKTSLSRNLS